MGLVAVVSWYHVVVDGEEVGDGLERVVEVRESVDHGHRAMLRKVGDVGVAIDTSDDA